MRSDFPIRKQPHTFGCLPTCVQAVLAFQGEDLSYKEVSDLCREIPEGGCIWGDAVTGLKLEYTIDEITTGDEIPKEALNKLRQVIEDNEQVVIVEIEPQLGQPGHAVVVIGFEQTPSVSENLEETLENVIYMDPDRGEIITMPTGAFLKKWQSRDFQAFCILEE